MFAIVADVAAELAIDHGYEMRVYLHHGDDEWFASVVFGTKPPRRWEFSTSGAMPDDAMRELVQMELASLLESM